MKKTILVSALILLSICGGAWTSAAEGPDIPEALAPWEDWVLHGEDRRRCPTSYLDGEDYRCLWPARLHLDLGETGGRFYQDWRVFARGWVPLPGRTGLWPGVVAVDGEGVPVIERQGRPHVYLHRGAHRIAGRFAWDRLPEMIHVPPASGLIRLRVNGEEVPFPVEERDGRLWLKKKEGVRTQEDREEIRVYRHIKDAIPMEVTTLFRINIAGQQREMALKGALWDGFVPMAVQSPLPARLGGNGDLMLQARPGRWEIRVKARSKGPVHRLGPRKTPYGQEIWAFQSQNHLRMVTIEGVPAIDPNQTDSPPNWRAHPTYLVDTDREVLFTEIRRGDPFPAPDRLALNRTWWLDFDGEGYTLQDKVSGTLSRQWHLAMNPPVDLGRVTVDGDDQLITAQGKARKPGVELRRGHLNLQAESRIQVPGGRLPAVGWDHDFQSLSGTLNLPPGWRLLAAEGVDAMPGTWIEDWSLLDLFFVLIIALAVTRLWGWPWGLLALPALALTYHEPGAPRVLWLVLLAPSALLRFLPLGWVRQGVHFFRLAALVALLAVAVPFMVQQVRWGLYPQLETRRPIPAQRVLRGGLEPSRSQGTAPMLKKMESLALQEDAAVTAAKKVDDEAERAVQIIDANALNQTGPGLPTWTWRSYPMTWNGPVEKTQEIRLMLLSPTLNLLLALVRVLLLAALIVRLLEAGPRAQGTRAAAAAPFILLVPLLFSCPVKAAPATGGFPPKELLEDLRERLLEKPDCLPRCAESPEMTLQADSGTLTLGFQVHAAQRTAVPLPGASEFWLPREVRIDDVPAEGLARDASGTLWMLVPEGVHAIDLWGPVPSVGEFQIPLPLTPKRVTCAVAGWEVQGVGEEGRVGESIKLIRTRGDGGQVAREGATPLTLPAFFHVERVLSLGLDWQVRSRITRLTPTGAPAVVAIPLLQGESVTTSGLRVGQGRVHIQMAPRTREIQWVSTLEKTARIALSAPKEAPWAETWTLEISPIWHADLSGIPLIHHEDRQGYWRPQWRPWPGEEVTVTVSRPEGIPGQVVTIDRASLTYTPGKRFNKAELTLKIRTSKGGQQRILLPEGARLQGVRIGGREQPIREAGREVILPLRPGAQDIFMQWHQGAASRSLIRCPEVRIGEQAVNAEVRVQMPPNRWILWTSGPLLGPAVLFWTYLVVVLLAAVILGRVSWTPLRRRHWFLLGLGLTQVHPLVAILVAGWILALGARCSRPMPGGPVLFDLSQVLLVLWTLAALVGLYAAIHEGLLGIPKMQVAGNGSTEALLRWTQDRIGDTLPRPRVLSLHLLVFRSLMLLWALWLAYALLGWLRWGWGCYTAGGAWRRVWRRKGKGEETRETARTGGA